jgi:hypothetical protein
MLQPRIYWVLVVCFLFTASPIWSQYAAVNRASAETADKVLFIVRVPRQRIVYSENIRLDYTVSNNGPKPIYLVLETPTRFGNERGTILVLGPDPNPIGHGGFKYGFVKIGSKERYEGHLIVPSKMYDKVDTWPVEVGFVYVNDITGLNRRLGPDEDPAILRSRLNERRKIVVVGQVGVVIAPY